MAEDGGVSAAVRTLLQERGRFLRAFLTSPRQVGAILPTSGRTVRSMLDLAPVERAGLVVELGAGTGALTREILRRMRPDATLLAFEIDPELAESLAADVADDRLQVVAGSATELSAHLGGRRPQVVVSALPFTSLGVDLTREILTEVANALAEDGVLLVLQYSPFRQRELERAFASVTRRLSPLNVPPAFVFACRAEPGEPAG
jgi:phospholipid N-methyltransferase